MLLSDREIRIALESGDLSINPLSPENSPRWQPASVDRYWILQSGYKRITRAPNKTISDVEDLDIDRYLSDYTEQVNIRATGGFTLPPGGFIIGRTLETITLSRFLSGRVEGRSRLARLGIGIHVTAPKIDPGYKNQITLEIFHVGKTNVLIPNQMTICTLLVERLGHPSGQQYNGIFQDQIEEHEST